jgi:hypothetical protein
VIHSVDTWGSTPFEWLHADTGKTATVREFGQEREGGSVGFWVVEAVKGMSLGGGRKLRGCRNARNSSRWCAVTGCFGAVASCFPASPACWKYRSTSLDLSPLACQCSWPGAVTVLRNTSPSPILSSLPTKCYGRSFRTAGNFASLSVPEAKVLEGPAR